MARERGFKLGSLQSVIAKRKLFPHRYLREGNREIGEGPRQIRRIENRTSSKS